MVVIAIIAILAALLLPALSKAKAQAQTTVCLNNLKQLQLAWLTYAHDNRDELPPNATYPNALGDVPMWVTGQITYESDPTKWLWVESTNTALLLQPGPGRLGPYVRAAGSYRCPADQSYIILNGGRYPRVRSYAINEYMGTTDGVAGPALQEVQRKLSDFRALPATEAFVFADEHDDSISDGKFTVNYLPTTWDELPTARHNGKGTFSFADGHVTSHKWLDPRTKVPIIRKPYQGGVLQPNSLDVHWVFNHATA